jgi:hypothetical protein
VAPGLATRAALVAFVAASAAVVSGCWTAPTAASRGNGQAPGQARLIQEGVAVQSVKDSLVVRSVDGVTRTVVAIDPENHTETAYQAGPGVANLDRIRPGDRIQATVAQRLTVLGSAGSRRAADDGAFCADADAKVLAVEPSYRLLTLRYPDGRRETFKVGLDVRLKQMEPGDDVLIRTVGTPALQVRGR